MFVGLDDHSSDAMDRNSQFRSQLHGLWPQPPRAPCEFGARDPPPSCRVRPLMPVTGCPRRTSTPIRELQNLDGLKGQPGTKVRQDAWARLHQDDPSVVSVDAPGTPVAEKVGPSPWRCPRNPSPAGPPPRTKAQPFSAEFRFPFSCSARSNVVRKRLRISRGVLQGLQARGQAHPRFAPKIRTARSSGQDPASCTKW